MHDNIYYMYIHVGVKESLTEEISLTEEYSLAESLLMNLWIYTENHSFVWFECHWGDIFLGSLDLNLQYNNGTDFEKIVL